jgi:serine/threonine protein kinase
MFGERNSTMLKLGLRAVRSRTFRESDAFMDDFIATLTHLGGVYAKFLQGILLGYSVTRKGPINLKQLDVFEDNTDPHLSELYIRSLLGNQHSRITSITNVPIGVGSYSAVYSAVLDGTKRVVIKVLRPGVKEEINKDLRFLRQLARVLKFANVTRLPTDVSQFYSAFKKACLKEMDLAKEIDFAERMHQRYIGHPYIVIPKTYTELCNDSVIVQDLIDGLSVKSVVDHYIRSGGSSRQYVQQAIGSDLYQLMRVLVYDTFYSFLSGQSFHGDLHPGNIRLLPDNKIALLDFGIEAEPYGVRVVAPAVNKLRSDMKFMEGDFDLARILDAHFRLYMSNLYNSIESILIHKQREMRDFFQSFAKSTGVDTTHASDSKRAEWLNNGPAYLLNDIMGDQKKVGVDLHIKDQTTQRAITTEYALLKALGIKGRDVLYPVYEKVCARVEQERPELFSQKKVMLPDLALENVYAWMEKLSANNPDLASKLRDMFNEKKTETA